MIWDGTLHGTHSPPSRAEVVRWVTPAVNNLKESEIIINAWQKLGFSWFPIGNGVAAWEVDTTAEVDVAQGDKEGVEDNGFEGNSDD